MESSFVIPLSSAPTAGEAGKMVAEMPRRERRRERLTMAKKRFRAIP